MTTLARDVHHSSLPHASCLVTYFQVCSTSARVGRLTSLHSGTASGNSTLSCTEIGSDHNCRLHLLVESHRYEVACLGGTKYDRGMGGGGGGGGGAR